jgi:hypothetical protein
MSQTVINSAEKLSQFIGDVREAWGKHKYLRVTVKTGKDRSLDQNAISHAWYAQVVRELREDDELGVKRFCKLTFGVPILRAEDADFREMYDAAIKFGLTYEQKLKAMDFIPVTSLMTVAQLNKYLHAMRDEYRDPKRANKVMLEFPPEEEKPVRRRAA